MTLSWGPHTSALPYDEEIAGFLTEQLSFESTEENKPEYSWDTRGLWEGVVYLVEVGKESIVFPAGLTHRVLQLLDANGIQPSVEQLFNTLTFPMSYTFPMPELRDVQKDVASRLISSVRGCREAAPRTGKTYEAYATMAELGLRSLYIVSRKEWAKQSLAKFRELAMADEPVGVWASGVREPSDMTVAIDAALLADLKSAKRRPQVEELLRSVNCIVFDEADATAGTPRACEILKRCHNAPYRFGFSATLTVPRQNGTSMLIEANTGPIVKITTASEALKKGYHAPGKMLFLKMPTILAHGGEADFQSIYDSYIIGNPYRNHAIAYLTQWAVVHKNWSVLILVKQIRHAEEIGKLLPGATVVTGYDSAGTREKVLEAFRASKERAVITTLYDRAVDLPDLDMCVYAGGGKSPAEYVQGYYRVKTQAPGGTKTAYFVDIFDRMRTGISYTQIGSIGRHSIDRRKVAKADPSWEVEEKELKDLGGFCEYMANMYPEGLRWPIVDPEEAVI